MRPTTPVAVGAAGAVGIMALPVGALVAVPALAGAVVMALGMRRGARGMVTLGAVLLLVAPFGAGFYGFSPGYVLLGTVGTILAWDAGEFAVGLDEAVTPEAATGRAEVVHSGGMAVLCGLLAGVTYLAWLFGQGALPTVSAPILALGVVVLGVGLAAGRA